eukprot:4683598-Amphidinium_carterae.2
MSQRMLNVQWNEQEIPGICEECIQLAIAPVTPEHAERWTDCATSGTDRDHMLLCPKGTSLFVPD